VAVRRRPEGRRAGYLDRQGLRRHDQAPQLQLAARVARQQPLAQRAGLDLHGAGPGPRVPGQEDVGPHGRRHRHHAEPRHRAHRRSAFAAAGARRRAGCQERPRGRAPGRSRPRRREPSDATRAPQRTGPGHGQGRRAGHRVRARLQRSAGAPGRRRLPGQRAPGHAPRRPRDRQAQHQEAVAPEGHRPCACGHDLSPLWRGGGRIFPNRPDENFSHKVNKKMYRAGMAAILSQLARDGRLAVVDSISVDAPKTKLLAQKFKAMGLESVLVIADRVDDNLRWHRATWPTCWWSSRATPIRCRSSSTRRCWSPRARSSSSRRCSHERKSKFLTKAAWRRCWSRRSSPKRPRASPRSTTRCCSRCCATRPSPRSRPPSS
jgi:ribosomal protein L4